MRKCQMWLHLWAVAVVAIGGNVSGAAAPVSDPTREREATPQAKAAAPVAAPAQLTIVRTGHEPPPAISPFDAEQARRHQEAWSAHLGIPVECTNSIGMQLVLIPPGEYMMGSPEADLNVELLERPQHRARITRTFYLGIYEVTQEQYNRVMGVNPSEYTGLQHPVQNVRGNEAVKFCELLSAMPEEKTAGRTYRLPTQAQWEYACRAGTTTRYYFGDDAQKLGEYAWFRDDRGNVIGRILEAVFSERIHPVGQKKPNAWGLYDMHGNVWEWCADWYDGTSYQSLPVDDPIGPATGFGLVYRGGGWDAPASSCRSAHRRVLRPNLRSNSLGFRVATVPSSQPASPGQE